MAETRIESISARLLRAAARHHPRRRRSHDTSTSSWRKRALRRAP